MRVIFMGSPDFSVPALEALIAAGHEIAAVYCQPPRPAGRGKKDRPTPVEARARSLGLEVRSPLNFRDPADQAAFAGLEADIAVVVAYGLILPQVVLDAPRLGCLNIHASLLPRWRGAAPIHRAIMAGDEKTGISIMQMEAGLDTGPVLAVQETPIGAKETTGQLHDRLADMGAALIVEAIGNLDTLTPMPQSVDGITYAEKIQKTEARIDWTKSAETIDRQIRGLAPFPGAWCMIGEERVKLLGAEIGTGSGSPGEILSDALDIACGSGAVRLTRLQRAGKAAMAPGEFTLGFELPIGSRLG